MMVTGRHRVCRYERLEENFYHKCTFWVQIPDIVDLEKKKKKT